MQVLAAAGPLEPAGTIGVWHGTAPAPSRRKAAPHYQNLATYAQDKQKSLFACYKLPT